MSRFTVMEAGTKNIELLRFEKGIVLPVNDTVSVEEPLEIQIVAGDNSSRTTSPISITMRTPGNDNELAIGFLFTEGVVHKPGDIMDSEIISENVIKVNLNPLLKVEAQSLTRNFYTTSSCGVCGKGSIDAISVSCKKVDSKITVNSSTVKSLANSLFNSQQNFQSTGGLHASALFDREGNLKLLREDVGRHNALDKVIGNQFLQGKISLYDSILLVSGRASFELVQKATIAGIPIMVAIGAPSSLAIDLAQEKGVTLIGFLKSDRFNIYTHQNRIELHEQRRV